MKYRSLAIPHDPTVRQLVQVIDYLQEQLSRDPKQPERHSPLVTGPGTPAHKKTSSSGPFNNLPAGHPGEFSVVRGKVALNDRKGNLLLVGDYAGLADDSVILLQTDGRDYVEICRVADPSVHGGVLPAGIAIGDTLYWDGIGWVRTSLVKVDVAGAQVTISLRTSFLNDMSVTQTSSTAFVVYDNTLTDQFAVDTLSGVTNVKGLTCNIQSPLTIVAGSLNQHEPIDPVAAAYTIGVGDYSVGINTSAPRIINMPASPQLGDTYEISDSTGGLSLSNTITINGNGHAINGAASLLLTGPAYTGVTVRYTGPTYGWRAVGTTASVPVQIAQAVQKVSPYPWTLVIPPFSGAAPLFADVIRLTTL